MSVMCLSNGSHWPATTAEYQKKKRESQLCKSQLPVSFSRRLCASATDPWRLLTPLCTHRIGSVHSSTGFVHSHRICRHHAGFVDITQDLYIHTGSVHSSTGFVDISTGLYTHTAFADTGSVHTTSYYIIGRVCKQQQTQHWKEIVVWTHYISTFICTVLHFYFYARELEGKEKAPGVYLEER